jgi:hypothetical protein
MLPGHLGSQQFFTSANRAMVLYVVLGGGAALRSRIPEINAILPTLSFSAEVGTP